MDLYPIRNRDTAQALKANKPGLAGPSYKLLTILPYSLTYFTRSEYNETWLTHIPIYERSHSTLPLLASS